MSATEENRNFGECFVLANVRMRGEQPVEIRGSPARLPGRTRRTSWSGSAGS